MGYRRDLFPSAARTATPTPAEVDEDTEGVRVVIDVTAIVSTPSVVFNIDGYDPLSDKWVPVISSAAIVAVGTTVLTVYPGAPVTTNVSANSLVPQRWRVRPVHGNANSITYTVGSELYSP